MPGNPKSARTRLSISELWRIVEVLGGDVPESHRRHAQDTKNEPELREWIADELGLDYAPEGRVRPFKNAELAKIRDLLQQEVDDVE
ncbi:MAG: hypothetical protein ABEJ26_06425 [Halosimplex sp.]